MAIQVPNNLKKVERDEFRRYIRSHLELHPQTTVATTFAAMQYVDENNKVGAQAYYGQSGIIVYQISTQGQKQ